MPIQYTRTFIMICEVEIHLINRFNVTSDSNSFTCDYVTPDDKYWFGVEIIHSFISAKPRKGERPNLLHRKSRG